MSIDSASRKAAVNSVRTTLGIGGALAIVVGIAVLIWPEKTEVAVTAIIAAYVIIAGVVYAGLGIFARGVRGGTRFGYLALGLIFILAGIVAFVNLAVTTELVAAFIGIMIAILWIVEGVVALSTLKDVASKGVTLAYAILNVVAGIVVFISVLGDKNVLWMLMGISLAVLGLVQLIRAFSFGRRR